MNKGPLLSGLFILIFSVAQEAHAQCDLGNGHGTRPLGTVVYNTNCDVLQVCRNDDQWHALGPFTAGCGGGASCMLDGQTVPHGDSHTFYSAEEHANCASISQLRTCTDGTLDGSGTYQYASCEAPAPDPCETGAIGTACADGAVYAGDTVGGARMYAAASDEGTTYVWGGYGEDDAADSTTDGLANTDALVADGHGHQAAEQCRDKGAEWYLPAQDELDVMYDNHSAIGGFDTGGSLYWSSTEGTSNSARIQRFSDGLQTNFHKGGTRLVRCVRR